jgi:hypothetical protein
MLQGGNAAHESGCYYGMALFYQYLFLMKMLIYNNGSSSCSRLAKSESLTKLF